MKIHDMVFGQDRTYSWDQKKPLIEYVKEHWLVFYKQFH